MSRRRMTPKQAASARTVDRLERELDIACRQLHKVYARLLRAYRTLRRSEGR